MKALGYWFSAAFTVFVNAFFQGLPAGATIGTSVGLGVGSGNPGASSPEEMGHKLFWAAIHTCITAGAFGLHRVLVWKDSNPIPNPFPNPQPFTIDTSKAEGGPAFHPEPAGAPKKQN